MKISHIAMYVQNIENAKKFFETYFELTVSEFFYDETTGFKNCFVNFDNGTKLELMTSPLMVHFPKELTRAGYSHIAISVGSKEKLLSIYETLKCDGYEFLVPPRESADGYFECICLDAENNQIEITI